MSDLQCPATLLFVRHGSADGALPRSLTLAGRVQAGTLAEELRGERVGQLRTSTMPRADQTSAILARALKLPAQPEPRLREFLIDEAEMPAYGIDQVTVDRTYRAWLSGDLTPKLYGESGADLLARFRAVGEEVADLGRGETALLVSHTGLLQLGLGLTCVNLRPEFVFANPLNLTGIARVSIDSSGWRCHTWNALPVG